MEATNVRVDAELLAQHRGELVRVIGRCELSDASANTATLICNGNIKLSTGDNPLTVGKNYEVIGKANALTLEVNVYSVIELSDTTNIDVALKLAHFINKVPELYIQ